MGKEVKCSECNGTGRVNNPSWQPGIGCEPREYDCPICGGSGWLVTEEKGDKPE